MIFKICCICKKIVENDGDFTTPIQYISQILVRIVTPSDLYIGEMEPNTVKKIYKSIFCAPCREKMDKLLDDVFKEKENE